MPKFNKRYDKPKRGSARSEARERGRKNDGPGGSSSGFELHVTKCDKCGRNCDVPFKPTQGKPIYCRSCFRGTTPEESGRAPAGRFNSRGNDRFEPRDRPQRDNSEDLEDIKRKLDKIMRALKIN